MLAKQLASNRFKSILEYFSCEVVDDKVIYHKQEDDDMLKDGQEVNVQGAFVFVNSCKPFLVEHYDRFNFDDLIDRIQKNDACLEYLKKLKESFYETIDCVSKMPAEEVKRNNVNRDELVNSLRSQPFSITKDSTKEQRLNFISNFSPFNLLNMITLDGKKCLTCYSYPTMLIFNEEVLHLIDLDEFEIDKDYCEWSLDEKDTLIIQFKHKGE